MKRFALAAAVVLLAACGAKEEMPAADSAAAAMTPAPAMDSVAPMMDSAMSHDSAADTTAH